MNEKKKFFCNFVSPSANSIDCSSFLLCFVRTLVDAQSKGTTALTHFECVCKRLIIAAIQTSSHRPSTTHTRTHYSSVWLVLTVSHSVIYFFSKISHFYLKNRVPVIVCQFRYHCGIVSWPKRNSECSVAENPVSCILYMDKIASLKTTNRKRLTNIYHAATECIVVTISTAIDTINTRNVLFLQHCFSLLSN